MYFDWHRFRGEQFEPPVVVDPRRRLRAALLVFALGLAAVFARVVQWDWTAGADLRRQAASPVTRHVPLAGVRGRIVSRDGAVLAEDRWTKALAVHYRYLQEPCDPTWLRLTARGQLSPSQRKRPECVAAQSQRVLQQRTELTARLCRLCGLSGRQWEERRRQIQEHVQQVSDAVNSLPRSSAGGQSPSGGNWLLDVLKASARPPEPARIVVVEEQQYHVVVDEVSSAVAEKIVARPEEYLGVRIIACRRRAYPLGTLAAHLLGYAAFDSESARSAGADRQRSDEFVGRSGLEQRYDGRLCGTPGEELELLDHSGRLLSTRRAIEPGAGRNLTLTIDSRVQQAAETLLDQALRRRAVTQLAGDAPLGGGAVVVMDLSSGELLAAASAPRFDPAWFAQGNARSVAKALADPDHPLFDRVASMALPPGSVFKIVTAVSLLESGALDPQEVFHCRGYLDTPDRWRCATFVRRGQGHGSVNLAEALAESCNVYFFDHARRLGPQLLWDWAQRFGFGSSTGSDVPQEARGALPQLPAADDPQREAWRTADTLQLCIGQGSLTATPLQVARLLAAVANGGRLVTPHLLGDCPDFRAAKMGLSPFVPGLHPATLAVVREGLQRTVSDPRGTAHDTLDGISVAGKTGTAQCGSQQPDHAWFAGYFPADRPRFVLVVVLEHAGDAATAACPLAKRLILRMEELGMLR